MAPIPGAIFNWCGHKYGYRNFETTRDDKSRNTLVFDFVTLGELLQNNHHKFGMSPNFAARWFEIDPSYTVIRVFAWMGILDLGRAQKPRYAPALPEAETTAEPAPVGGELTPFDAVRQTAEAPRGLPPFR